MHHGERDASPTLYNEGENMLKALSFAVPGERELTIADIMKRLDKPRAYVTKLLKSGRIRYRREGREHRVTETDFQTYIKNTYPEKTADGP